VWPASSGRSALPGRGWLLLVGVFEVAVAAAAAAVGCLVARVLRLGAHPLGWSWVEDLVRGAARTLLHWPGAPLRATRCMGSLQPLQVGLDDGAALAVPGTLRKRGTRAPPPFLPPFPPYFISSPHSHLASHRASPRRGRPAGAGGLLAGRAAELAARRRLVVTAAAARGAAGPRPRNRPRRVPVPLHLCILLCPCPCP
jgi:hypothetical protein